jgi:hypothetical protein
MVIAAVSDGTAIVVPITSLFDEFHVDLWSQ